MKRILAFILICLLLAVTVYAVDSAACAVAASAVSGSPGETVEVTVSVSGNPGFTNYAMLLDYDREALTLQAITPAESGLLTSANCDYKAADGKSYGFVTAAAEAEQSDDGDLFTATFLVADGFTGEAAVTPIVQYMRNNAANYRIFAEIQTLVSAGSVTVGSTDTAELPGDVDGDGYVTAIDAAKVFSVSLGRIELTGDALAAADIDGDGYVTAMDAVKIYKQSLGG